MIITFLIFFFINLKDIFFQYIKELANKTLRIVKKY